MTITASAPNASSGTRIVLYDAVAPTVSSADTGYYTDNTLTTELSGIIKTGGNIYTKVSFSEVVGRPRQPPAPRGRPSSIRLPALTRSTAS